MLSCRGGREPRCGDSGCPLEVLLLHPVSQLGRLSASVCPPHTSWHVTWDSGTGADSTDQRIRADCVQVPALPLPGCVALGESLHSSGPPFLSGES